jgi:DNA-3-methyladenine glycosylase II
MERFPGLRPVCFYSPYEAGVWAVISHRIQMRQASAIKRRLAEAFGEDVSIHGQPLRSFPSPRALVDLPEFPGLPAAKLARIAAIASAALAGDLDAASLRTLPDAEALALLQRLPGIGPFSSELILLRGAGHPDYLTLQEPRFRQAVRQAYALDHEPTDTELQRISDAWRPYRMWITFLFRQSAAH